MGILNAERDFYCKLGYDKNMIGEKGLLARVKEHEAKIGGAEDDYSKLDQGSRD